MFPKKDLYLHFPHKQLLMVIPVMAVISHKQRWDNCEMIGVDGWAYTTSQVSDFTIVDCLHASVLVSFNHDYDLSPILKKYI